ncbi:DUF6126 family protein [Streptacidiphilus cavernicola]|uniref:DUF6126 family protein n=1 Tax=Streptacidiphilus cavernicola TaxID=3342716 RepID=A0ABV6VWI2_9ACTN
MKEDSAPPDESAFGDQPVTGSTEGTVRGNRGVWIRAFIYVIGFHVFAGFIMLLFYAGGHNR